MVFTLQQHRAQTGTAALSLEGWKQHAGTEWGHGKAGKCTVAPQRRELSIQHLPFSLLRSSLNRDFNWQGKDKWEALAASARVVYT